MAIRICFYIVCGGFCDTATEQGSCNGDQDHTAHKSQKYFLPLPLQKSLWTLDPKKSCFIFLQGPYPCLQFMSIYVSVGECIRIYVSMSYTDN